MLWVVLAAIVAGAVGWTVGRRRPVSVPPIVVSAETTSSDARIRQVVETLALGLVVFDTDGSEIFRNSSAVRFGEARHQKPLVEAALAETAQLAALDGRVERSLDLLGPPRRVLDFTGASVGTADGDVGVVVVIEEVTEKRRITEVRRDFVANVSHELKTPVGAMGVLAEALVDADDPAVVARLGGRLHAEAIRLGNTIDDLLALSEIESGALTVPTAVDPALMIAGALERSSAAAELRSVAIVVDDRSAGRWILGDRRQLVAAVGNLVDNAVKYSDPGSEVSIVVAPHTADVDRLVVEVTDRGIGIPPADRERIFERFYRVDPARSRNTGGTGLGLSIVRHVAMNHAGTVEVESVEGQGSTFRLCLPAVDQAAVPSVSSPGG